MKRSEYAQWMAAAILHIPIANTQRTFILIAFVALLTPLAGRTQESALPALSPDAIVEGYGGCFGPRCFITAAALDGETALTINSGPSVSVTQRDNAGQWPLQQVLTNPDFVVPSTYPAIERALPFPPFDAPLALSGDMLFVTGTSKKYNQRPVVYVMKRDGGQWSKQQVLALQKPAGNPDATVVDIALDGGIALVSSTHTRSEQGNVVSSSSRVDVYIRQASGSYSRRAILAPTSRTETQQPALYRVALSGRLALIGDSTANNGIGRAYLYELTSTGWRLRKSFAPAPASQPDTRFGDVVAIKGERVAIGALEEAVAPNQFGAIYIYDKSGSSWPLSQVVTAPEFFPSEGSQPQAEDGWRFGENIALDGDRLAVTMESANWWAPPPLAYLFERRSSTWTAVATFASPAGLPFAERAFFSSGRLLLGAHDEAYSQEGYVFELPDIGTIIPD
jgi:hypothetical protein